MIRLLAAVLLLTACPSGPTIRYTTSHGIQVAGERTPTPADVERWTAEVAVAFGKATCPELASVTRDKALAMLSHSASRARHVRLLWATGQPYASGRFLRAYNRGGYQHELTHALLDALGIPWNEQGHHAVMQRCKVP